MEGLEEGISACNSMPAKDKTNQQHWVLSLFNDGAGPGTARAWNLIHRWRGRRHGLGSVQGHAWNPKHRGKIGKGQGSELSRMSWTLFKWHQFCCPCRPALASTPAHTKPTAGQMLEEPGTRDTPSFCITNQDHPSWLWWTLEPRRPYGLETDSSRVSGGPILRLWSTMAQFTHRHRERLEFSQVMRRSRSNGQTRSCSTDGGCKERER